MGEYRFKIYNLRKSYQNDGMLFLDAVIDEFGKFLFGKEWYECKYLEMLPIASSISSTRPKTYLSRAKGKRYFWRYIVTFENENYPNGKITKQKIPVSESDYEGVQKAKSMLLEVKKKCFTFLKKTTLVI